MVNIRDIQGKSFEDLTFEEFHSIFNRSFWKAFSRLPIPLLELEGQIGIGEKEYTRLLEIKREALIKELYFSIKEKTYYPHTPAYYLIKDKGMGIARVIPVFTAKDYCIYYYCIFRLETILAVDRVKNTFGGWSLGGRMRQSEEEELDSIKTTIDEIELSSWLGVSAPSYSFTPNAWSKIYGDFNAKLFATLKTEQQKFYAEFDISNFYDCIRLDILERKIRQRFDKGYEDDVTLLFHFLHYWNRNLNHYNPQSVGIPQDAMNDCSRILANFYLQEYDTFVARLCHEKSAVYFRYADDQFLFAESSEVIRYILYKASKKLAALGLSINQKKVRTGLTKELIVYRSFEIFDKLDIENDENEVEKVETFIDEYFNLLDNGDIGNIKNHGVNLLNRALSFTNSLKKLPLAKKLRLLSYYLDGSYLLDSRTDQLSRIYSLLTTDEERIGFIALLEDLSSKNLHNHFHFQVLVFFRNQKIDFSKIQTRIDELNND